MVANPNEHQEGHLNATSWIIDARWYYAPLAFFLGTVVAGIGSGSRGLETLLVVSLVLVLLSNVGFYLWLKHLQNTDEKGYALQILNATQVGLDLLFFFIVMIVSGGVESVGHVFFFVPIVVSVILFGFHGALLVALSSGALVFIAALLGGNIISLPSIFPNVAFPNQDPAILITKAGIVSLIYLLTGFFGGYITRIINARDILLTEQIGHESDQIAKLEKLNVAFDESAKLLVRRDLELYKANQKLTKLDQMKSEIISVVAHQLRTPLSAIKWTLKMLLDGDVGALPEEQHALLAKGFESNERMIMLINDLLSVDRLESGKFKYVFVPVQFEELLRAMVSDLLPVADEKKVHVELDLPPTLLPKIKVDPDKIHDVLQNLIDNAIKYSKAGGTVHVTLTQEDKYLRLAVKDQGIGIPDSEKDKIFARFFRATNATRTETNGSGLGLFIAQSIVKRHGGNVWFESREGEGTTFFATLPLSA